jgi:acetyl esterase
MRPPLAPALRALLDEQARNAPPPPAGPVPDSVRARAIRMMLAKALTDRPAVDGLPNDIHSTDVELPGGLRARAYVGAGRAAPGAPADTPLLVWFHGGGWVAGSIDTVDPFCRLFAHQAGVHILSVDYRLAPEHPWPAALDDGTAAIAWARAHAASLGASPERLMLGGDSAGGNVAAVLAHRLCRDGTPPWLRALILSCPVTDRPDAGHASYTENATGFGLEAASMAWFWNQYAGGADLSDPGLSPLRIDPVPALPPTLVTSAGYDVLRDEAVAYADKLAAAGVAVTHQPMPDLNHNAAVTPGTVARFPETRAALAAMAAWTRAVPSGEDSGSR